MKYALEQRLRLIDFLLIHYGTVRRDALVDYFALSVAQASNDFADYQALAPDNMVYDRSEKTYRRAPTFRRFFP